MRDPIEKQIPLADGSFKTFILTKVPTDIGLRLSVLVFNMLKNSNFELDELMPKIFAHVGIRHENGNIFYLSSVDLINNHVPNWEVAVELIAEMVKYNCSFLQIGSNSNFLDRLSQNLKY